ncbi:hypothetical protein J3R83DRAFT_11395 [Lanmaoa asiatica]|nr:hypothetical protein J3R83DRAFT_11395 [Lanmaoa asiatica]
MAIAKLLLLLIVVNTQQYTTTAPNRPSTEELREQCSSERAVPYLMAITRNLMWSWAFLEGSVLFALSGYCPPVLSRPVLHVLLPSTTTSDPTALTASFLVGTLLTLAGALLRVHCYHILGPRFTFELSIRRSHVLVTDGVYGVVRHPSYTGAIALAVGWLLCMLDRRGWVMAVCAGPIAATGGGDGDGSGNVIVTGVWACGWATALAMLYVLTFKRMINEDAMLEKNFGEEWRAWAKRVPCYLIPGVY